MELFFSYTFASKNTQVLPRSISLCFESTNKCFLTTFGIKMYPHFYSRLQVCRKIKLGAQIFSRASTGVALFPTFCRNVAGPQQLSRTLTARICCFSKTVLKATERVDKTGVASITSRLHLCIRRAMRHRKVCLLGVSWLRWRAYIFLCCLHTGPRLSLCLCLFVLWPPQKAHHPTLLSLICLVDHRLFPFPFYFYVLPSTIASGL